MRDKLPDYFYIKTRKCKDKNRAIVKMLLEFGIRVHEDNTIEESLDEYDSLFSDDHDLNINGNELHGSHGSSLEKLPLSKLMQEYGKLT